MNEHDKIAHQLEKMNQKLERLISLLADARINLQSSASVAPLIGSTGEVNIEKQSEK